MMESKDNRGGKRQACGRKPGRKRATIYLQVPIDVVQIIERLRPYFGQLVADKAEEIAATMESK